MKQKPRPDLAPVIISLAALVILSLTGCVNPSVPIPAADSMPSPTVPAPPPTVSAPPETASPTPEQPAAPATVPPETAAPVPAEETGRVDVIYFHRTQRCHSCTYAEAQTVATLETDFASELADGTVTFASIDIQDEANSEIITKYSAYSSQLFVTTLAGDSETTTEIIEFWDYIDNDDGFSQLIISRVNEALAGIG